MVVPEWQKVPVLSGRTARRILRSEPGAVRVSLDLGKTVQVVGVEEDIVALPDGQVLPREELADAFSDPEDCVEVRDGRPRKIYFFDPGQRKYYKLYQPFEGRAPTIIINGHTMHPIAGADPWEGTRRMVQEVSGGGGECFDTCCGLGYSVQMLAQEGFRKVTTCEIDASVLEIASLNPWSEKLFTAPQTELHHADLRDFANDCEDRRFSCVFHDPPTIYQAGELYSEELYRAFLRILRSRGVLYHYVGAPGGRGGRDYAHGVMERLRKVGFGRIRRAAAGVLAVKPQSV